MGKTVGDQRQMNTKEDQVKVDQAIPYSGGAQQAGNSGKRRQALKASENTVGNFREKGQFNQVCALNCDLLFKGTKGNPQQKHPEAIVGKYLWWKASLLGPCIEYRKFSEGPMIAKYSIHKACLIHLQIGVHSRSRYFSTEIMCPEFLGFFVYGK